MLIPRAVKRVFSLNLDDNSDRETYEEILNNPANRIISRKWVTQTETTSSGDSTISTSEQYIYLEVEVCGL